jgi:hypothetical protein
MGKRLKENISSRYFEAANLLNSKKTRRRIVAYVESYDDIFFWRMLLSSYEDQTRYFEVMLPTRVNYLERGKKAVLMNLLSQNVGTDMIACVDADYDYLIQGATPVSHEILNNRYIFHTYAYAIENLQCYAPSLHDVTVAVTLNDHAIFDFEDYLSQYSEAIYPLFVWNIWYYRTTHYGDFTITDFNKVIDMGNFNLNDPYYAISNIRHKVGRRIEQFQRQNPNARESYAQVKRELSELGVTPQTTYLYIQGHHLFDNVVVPMLSKVCDRLVRERENEIYRQARHNTQMRNELSCYSHSLEDIVSMLKKNFGYMNSEPVRKIKADIESLFHHEDETETPKP